MKDEYPNEWENGLITGFVCGIIITGFSFWLAGMAV